MGKAARPTHTWTTSGCNRRLLNAATFTTSRALKSAIACSRVVEWPRLCFAPSFPRQFPSHCP